MKLSLSSTGSLRVLAQFAALACATPAAAQDPAALQQQIQQLQADFQRQIQDLRAQLKQVQAEAAAIQLRPGASSERTTGRWPFSTLEKGLYGQRPLLRKSQRKV